MPDPTGHWHVALNDTPLAASPTWTRMDTAMNVQEIRIDRGRQGEFDKTDTGTCEILVNDTDGLLDPTNTGSTYYGKLLGKQSAVCVYNPFNSTWYQVYRGTIDAIEYDVDPSNKLTRTRVILVDAFDYLSNIEMVAGSFGDALPTGVDAGAIFYDDAAVDDRIIQLLTDADWPSSRYVVFSGNVTVQETIYDSGDDLLGALWDAADAEFPGVANIYCDKQNRVVFHGRLARFNPASVAADAGSSAWAYTAWKAGDGDAFALDSARAQIRAPLSYDYTRKRVINAGLAYQKGIDQSAISGQLITNATSITRYGVRTWSRTDLITKQHKTNGNTGAQETKLFASYYVANYKDPYVRLDRMAFRSVRPTDTRASATWGLISGVEIADTIDLATTGPGGNTGFSETFYVEGIHYVIRELAGTYQDVSLEVDVSPSTYYSTNPF